MGGAYRKNIEVSFSLAGAMALLDDASDERKTVLAAVLKEFNRLVLEEVHLAQARSRPGRFAH